MAITGVGVKTPAGGDVGDLWSVLAAGRSVIGPIKGFDAAGLPVRFAGELQAFDPVPYLGPKVSRNTDRAAQLGFAAAADALADASLPATDPSRCAVMVGTGMGGTESFFTHVRTYLEGGPGRVTPRATTMIMANATAALIAMELGWSGPNLCVSTACAAGTHAIGEGFCLIRAGTADVVLAGGTDAAVNRIVVAAFARMGALSTRNEMPERASRPFDIKRDGFVLSEGAGFAVLERLDRAIARRANIYGEILGYGRNSDAFHMTAPSPSGEGAASCMRSALADARLDPSSVWHINAHGSSTELNDMAEAKAIRAVFGDRAPPVTSAKGAIGHSIGAAGAIEAIASLVAIGHGIVPPVANLDDLDRRLDIDAVMTRPREGSSGPVLSNSFAFGGHNASLVLAPRHDPPPTDAIRQRIRPERPGR